jgi:Carboxypeptidase regulatory-like domain
MVVAKADGTPLKGATVHLWTTSEHDRTIAAKSGVDGRFLLKNVPAGNYHLRVSRNGYFDVQFGQKKPSDPGAIINLQPGQNMPDLVFKMGRAEVISGRVFDEDGEPMAKVMIEALRNSYKEGHRELTLVTQELERSRGVPTLRAFAWALFRECGTAFVEPCGGGKRETAAAKKVMREFITRTR